MIRCDAHGLQFIAFVPATIGDAVEAGAQWPATRIIRVYVDDTTYPRARRWLDRSTVGDIDDQLIAVEHGPALLCSECLYSWLRARGVDLSYSPEEQRFERLRDAFTDLPPVWSRS